MDRLMSLLAFAVLLGFLGILGYFVPSPDLLAVIGLTVGLVGFDMYRSAWHKKD
ncbi:MAG: hypothetical protein JJ872_07700 [Marivivens sp.]|jgi:hypothetical protein|nr:hypothetical protein [Marivivens sp.]